MMIRSTAEIGSEFAIPAGVGINLAVIPLVVAV